MLYISLIVYVTSLVSLIVRLVNNGGIKNFSLLDRLLASLIVITPVVNTIVLIYLYYIDTNK